MSLAIGRKTFWRLLSAVPLALAGTGCARRQPGAPAGEEQFGDRILRDTATAMLSFGAYIGDRLGIYRAMAAAGRSTVPQLASRTGLNQRYLQEWLGLMVTAAYVEYDPEGETYWLPPDHATVLCDENSPLFGAGLIESLACVFVTPKVLEGFRGGKGPVPADYPPEQWEGIERQMTPVYRHALVQSYLAAMPEVMDRLNQGGTALDLGCRGGLASITIAKAFPAARVFGVDVHAASVERARANAAAAGLAGRIRFETYDGTVLPRNQFDLITTCHAIHHAADPVRLLGSVREALTDGGVLLMLEGNVPEELRNNINPWGNWLHGLSLFYCMSSSLAEGGPGYGAVSKESDVRVLARRAGFTRFRRLPVESRYDAVYEMRA